MKLKVLTAVKYNGNWYNKGTVFECKNKADIEHIVSSGGASKLDSGSDDEKISIENLCKIDGVNKKIAKILIGANIDTVEKASTLEVKDLVSISGISDKIAEKIFKSFVTEE